MCRERGTQATPREISAKDGQLRLVEKKVGGGGAGGYSKSAPTNISARAFSSTKRWLGLGNTRTTTTREGKRGREKKERGNSGSPQGEFAVLFGCCTGSLTIRRRYSKSLFGQ